MTSTVRMLMVGIGLVLNTFALAALTLGGGAAFTAIQKWYMSYAYVPNAVINPSLVVWIFPAFYGLILIIEVILIYSSYQQVFATKIYTGEM